MKKVVLFLMMSFALASVTFAGDYKLNDQEIDVLMSSATEVSVEEVLSVDLGMNAASSNAVLNAASPNAWAAWAICWVGGGFGIHRHYLGTKDNMWFLYTITCCGIFGIVPTVDWVVLLVGAIKDDIRGYVNNDKFFMW